jgi:hypothetical protein
MVCRMADLNETGVCCVFSDVSSSVNFLDHIHMCVSS